MADGDINLATLWIPVAPETSKVGPALEQAGKEAKGRFSQGVKGIGEDIHENLAKAGAKAKDIFTRAGADSGKAMSAAFMAGSKDLEKAFSGLKSGDVANALDHAQKSMEGINNLTKRVGIDISGWSPEIAKSDGQLAGASDKLADMVSGATNLAGTFDGLPGKIGKAAGAVSKLGGEIGIAVATLQTIGPYLDKIDQKIHDSSGIGKWGEEHSPSTWPQGLADMLGADKVRAFMGKTFGYNPEDPFGDRPGSGPAPSGPIGSSAAAAIAKLPPPGPEVPYNFMGPLPPGAHRGPKPPAANPYKGYWDPGGFGGTSDSTPESDPTPSSRSGGGGGGGARAGGSGLRLPSVSSRADLRAAGSRVANLFAFAHSLVGTPYSQELRNDCSGMVSRLANVALGLEPAASFSTVNEGQWLFSHGFEPGLGGPNDLNIGWYDHGGGNAGHTAATLPGGVHAESGGSHGSFLLGPGAAGAENSEFTQHAHLSMGAMGSASSSMGGDNGPLGSKEDPVYTAPSDTGAEGSSGSTFQSQGQQLGQGLLSGLMQSIGLDGSVFGGKSPLDWGAVKLGGGLLNYGMGLMNSMSPGRGGGGGLGGLAGLIPGPGAMISAAAAPAGGSIGLKDAVGGGPTTIHYDNSTTVNGPFNAARDGFQEAQFQSNAAQQNPPRSNGILSGVPQGS